MKKYILGISLLFVLITIQPTFGQTNVKLAERIDSLYAKDQGIQVDLSNAINAKVSMDSIQKIQTLEKQTFDRHIPIIKNIITKYGYPTASLVGKESSGHFFVLIQHSDSEPQFQASMLPILQELADKGEVEKKQFAYLYDRVQRNTGKKQLYGTQLSFGPEGNLFDNSGKILIPPDLADPENVDKRRKEMGLEPLEQYYETALKAFGRPRKK